MKIAYCFSGMIRHLDECGPKWKLFLEKNPGDVYGHFWEKSDKNESDTVEKFIEIFNPKKVELEDFKIFKESAVDIMMQNITVPNTLWLEIQDSIRDGRFISFHYKIWKANQLSLKEDYDVIVRCRTDCYPDLNLAIEKNDMLNIPTGTVHVASWINSGGPIDLFAYGNRKIMNYYSSLYLYIMKYLHEGYYCYPYEYILGVHLNHKDIKIRELASDIYSKIHCSYNSWANKTELIYNTSKLPQMDPIHYCYNENRTL